MPRHHRKHSDGSSSSSSSSSHSHHKHKHDHDKRKHDHDHKHKHDHDKHKHDHHHEEEVSAYGKAPEIEKTQEAMASTSISDDAAVLPPVVAATVLAPLAAGTYASSASSATSSSQQQTSPKKKLPIKTSQLYGGEGGGQFDDGFHKKIIEISIQQGAVIDSIEMLYYGGQKVKHGGDGGGDEKLTLREDEYVNEVVIKATSKVVCGLTFKTNLGRTLGPCGGDGAVLISGLSKPTETIVKAPGDGYGLRGIKGRQGKYLDAIGFHWGGIL